MSRHEFLQVIKLALVVLAGQLVLVRYFIHVKRQADGGMDD